MTNIKYDINFYNSICKDYPLIKEEKIDLFNKFQVEEWLNKKTFIPKRSNNNEKVRLIRGSSIHRELIRLAKKYFNIEISICDLYTKNIHIDDTKAYRWVILNEDEASRLGLQLFKSCDICSRNRILFIVHDIITYETCNIVKCPLCSRKALIRYVCKYCSSIGINIRNSLENNDTF